MSEVSAPRLCIRYGPFQIHWVNFVALLAFCSLAFRGNMNMNEKLTMLQFNFPTQIFNQWKC